MSTDQTERAATSPEVVRLRARVAQLEDELAELQAWANGVVADAQKRVYWLDRMHLDLDPIMRRVPFDYALDRFRRLKGWYHQARRPVDAVGRFVRRLTS